MEITQILNHGGVSQAGDLLPRPERERYKTMTLAAYEFIHRFLTRVLPQGLHRIRHYRLFAIGGHAYDLFTRWNGC